MILFSCFLIEYMGNKVLALHLGGISFSRRIEGEGHL